jgi:DNA-directed RNA polymerase subunit beta'
MDTKKSEFFQTNSVLNSTSKYDFFGNGVTNSPLFGVGRIEKVEIGVASPTQIQKWAERFIPTGEKVGEVTSWETLNYKTLKPEPNGLFCQKIFGPVVNFTCACGKKSPKVQRGICPKCGVERTHSRVRRYRLGYIKLKQPVVHTLYASYRPSPLNLCLNWSTKPVQAVMKTAEFCSLSSTFSIFRSQIETRSFYQTNETESLTLLKTNQQKQFSSQKTATPRLFAVSVESVSKSTANFSEIRLHATSFEPRLYGVAYDATWRQVEEFQEFLFYLWEQSYSYELPISYYSFLKPLKKQASDIPKHDQAYAIQTGGFAFQQILSYMNGTRLKKEYAYHYAVAQGYIRYIKEILPTLNPVVMEHRKERKRLLIKLRKLRDLQLKRKRQIELFRDFQHSKKHPAWMILSYLPVLPPGLRPITSIRGELVVSDINTLYRKVLIRNKRITRGANFGVFDTALSGSWLSWCYNLRQVQEAVDDLLKTGSVESGKPLKSLLEGLKGKQGRFRQHLLGKRVDYSGRSVIVVGPQLQLHQCGLPKQMAVELFLPFIIQKLKRKKIVATTTAAKSLIAERNPIIWAILGEILKTHPILLNRAPTLHRLGFQAFLPKLVEGKAILLHPLVCPAFNADFDGDQMAVHVPLAAKTRAEALTLLWSRNHLLAPASGQPLLLPTQDMVLGFYYLTCSLEKLVQPLDNLISSRKVLETNQPHANSVIVFNSSNFNHTENGNESKFDKNEILSDPLVKTLTEQNGIKDEFEKAVKENPNQLYFSEFSQVKRAYDRGLVDLHTPIWVKWSGFVQTFLSKQQAQTKETVIETRLDLSGHQENLFLDNCSRWFPNSDISAQLKQTKFVRTTPGRILMHFWLFESLTK